MRLDLTHNLKDVIRGVDRLSSQLPFATAMALTGTVKAIEKAMPAAVEADLDKPTEFTKRGFFTMPAKKDKLEATVAVKQVQAEYLGYQVRGGLRRPKRKALRLPSNVQLNAQGNMPAGLVRQLVARAKQNKRATKGQARRFGVSQELDLFYGEPGDGRPAGIYKRVVISATRHQLVPIVVFPQQSAKYEKRFDFYGRAEKIARREFPLQLRAAWAKALATAR